jgi:hypothetical protein
MSEGLTLQEKIVQTQFELLREHIGERVLVEYYSNGRLHTEILTLKQVTDYTGIVFDCMYMPFIGYDCGIKRVTTLEGKELYAAQIYYEPHRCYDRYELIALVRRVFGPHEAKRREEVFFSEEKAEAEREKKEKEAVIKYQQEELPKILLESRKYILDDKYEEWKKLCITNSKSSYSISIIRMVYEALVLISEGKSFKEAIDFVDQKHNSSGYATGLVAATISEFAKVGEEFKKYWNGQFTQEEVDGTINPAIIHINR